MEAGQAVTLLSPDPEGSSPSLPTLCCLDRAGKVPGWKPEVIRKDGQVRILQAAFILLILPVCQTY